MPINLDIIKPTREVERSLRDNYIYKDIDFDLKVIASESGELFKGMQQYDFNPLYDIKAIITSLKNILTTSPGEKLLNPTFGLDLRDYLFEPVTETRGYFIGEDILEGVSNQEPRISLNEVRVRVNPDEQQYEIILKIDIPSLKVYDLSLQGVLNNDGYTFV